MKQGRSFLRRPEYLLPMLSDCIGRIYQPHNWGLWHGNYDLFLWLITGMVCVCMKSVSGAVLRIQSFFSLDKIYLYTNVFVETCIFLFEGNYQNPIPQKASNSAFGSPSQSFPIHHYHIYIYIYIYTLWWTNIAMENHHISWENPL